MGKLVDILLSAGKKIKKRKLSPKEAKARRLEHMAALKKRGKELIRSLEKQDNKYASKYKMLESQQGQFKDIAARIYDDPIEKKVKYEALIERLITLEERKQVLQAHRTVLNKILVRTYQEIEEHAKAAECYDTLAKLDPENENFWECEALDCRRADDDATFRRIIGDLNQEDLQTLQTLTKALRESTPPVEKWSLCPPFANLEYTIEKRLKTNFDRKAYRKQLEAEIQAIYEEKYAKPPEK